MCDKRTCRKTINYTTFSDIGERVLKEDQVESLGICSKLIMENLLLVKSDISDYLSENSIEELYDVDDLKSCVSFIRDLRTTFKKGIFVSKLDMGEVKFEKESL